MPNQYSSYTEEEREEIAAEREITVDPEDHWLLREHTWSITGLGYVRTTLPGNPQKHVMLQHCIVGRPIDGREVDHINRNKRDNRRSNLRYITHSGNRLNSERSDAAFSVYPVTGSVTWQVIIVRKKVRHYLGTFGNIEEAEGARDLWLSEHGTYE